MPATAEELNTPATAKVEGADYDLIDLDDELAELVRSCARGVYQRALLAGRYADSRVGLIARINSRLPDGWSAASCLVLFHDSNRWQRHLVLFDAAGRVHVW